MRDCLIALAVAAVLGLICTVPPQSASARVSAGGVSASLSFSTGGR